MPSSVIRGFDYDAVKHRLNVEFVSGRLYAYHDVPERLYQGMRKAISKGSFFNRRIRSRFDYTLVKR